MVGHAATALPWLSVGRLSAPLAGRPLPRRTNPAAAGCSPGLFLGHFPELAEGGLPMVPAALCVCSSAKTRFITAQVPEQKSPVVPSWSFIAAIKHLLNTPHPPKPGRWRRSEGGLWRVTPESPPGAGPRGSIFGEFESRGAHLNQN